jgi:hypothetical protein
MVHRNVVRCAALALTGLAAGPLAAAPGMYATLSVGNARVDETGGFAVQGLAFSGPVTHDICNSQATITVGARPVVGRLEDNDTEYRFGVGWRGDGAWAFELGYFNVARLASSAGSGPYSVTQPACPDFTVDARGVEIDRIKASGISLGPVYHVPLGRRLELDLRAMINLYDLTVESQWQVEVTENENGVPFRTFPTAGVTGSESKHGVDGGLGLGLSYRVNDEMRLRGAFERQVIGDVTLDVSLVGLTVEF